MKIQFDYASCVLALPREEAKGFVELSIDLVISGYDPVSEVVPVYVEEDGTRYHGAVVFYWDKHKSSLICNITLKGYATSVVLSGFSDDDSVNFDSIIDRLSTEFSDFVAKMEAIRKRGENNLYL